MKKNNLKQNIKRATIAGLAALTLGNIGGCANTPEARNTMDQIAEQVIFQGGAASLRNKGKYNEGRALEVTGKIMGDIEASKAGKSETNIYLNGREREILTCLNPNGNEYDVYINDHGQYVWLDNDRWAIKCNKVY